MKKIYCLFLGGILLFFTTGCSFVYNLEIADVIVEDNQFLLNHSEVYGDVKDSIVNMVHKYTGETDSLGMYKQDYVTLDAGLTGMSFLDEFSYIDYKKSPSASLCFDNYSVVNDDNIMTIATSSGFSCFNKYLELENVTVNVTSKYKVVDSNADNVKSGVYTWHINEVNANDKQLFISVDLNSPVNRISFFQRNALFIIFIGATIIGSIIYIFMKKHSERVNEI